jgi:hypothetical protein
MAAWKGIAWKKVQGMSSASKSGFTKPRRESGDYFPPGMRDKHRNAEERCEVKVSRTVPEQR